MAITLTVTTESGDVHQVQVDANESIENLKALLEVETGIPLAEQAVAFHGRELPDTATLASSGVGDNELLLVARKRRAGAAAGGPQPAAAASTGPQTPQQVQQYIRNNPQMLQQLLHQDRELAEAALNDDISVLSRLLQTRQLRRFQEEQARMREIEELNADPFNPDNQRKIEEHIRMGQVQENLENAMEQMPEAFARVTMLYVDCMVNNVPVKAFVDSGAQTTIMSEACAARCGILRLIDRRYSGVAKGVGTAKITGRVHMAPIKLGNTFFPCSFTILEEQSMEFLLGLDMLRRHACQIDLRSNVLRVGEEAVPFLHENALPLHLRDEASGPGSPEVPRPSGSAASQPASAPAPAPAAQPSSAGGGSQAAPSPMHPMAPFHAPQPVSGPVGGVGMQFPEPVIRQLMDLGFAREQVQAALRAAGGNAEVAASMLFGA